MRKSWGLITISAVFLIILIAIPFLLALKKGKSLTIIPKSKVISNKGIYVTYHVAKLPKRFRELKKQAKIAGIDTLVIDVKETLSSPFVALAKQKKLSPSIKIEPNPWLSKLVTELHNEGFIVTARMVVFKDDHLILSRPDLGVKVGPGGLYRDRKGGKWADPYSDEVRLYNALIAETAAAAGVDEIQFDYIRFPAEGEAKFAYYPHQKEKVSRVDIICEFLKEVRERTARYNTSLAVDIFGVTAWQSKKDVKNLGQDLKQMAKYIDVLSPMFYPSHFHAGYDGYANPGSQPYYFVNVGVKKTREILSTEATVIVPWIQGFNMSSPNYGPGYITEQVKAAKEGGAKGYLIWNARNVYAVPFAALKK